MAAQKTDKAAVVVLKECKAINYLTFLCSEIRLLNKVFIPFKSMSQPTLSNS